MTSGRSSDPAVVVTRWYRVTTALALACLGVALLVYGAPGDLGLVALFMALVLLPATGAFELPSFAVGSPSTAIVLSSVSALRPRDAVVGALVVGACDGVDWKRLRRQRLDLTLFNTSQLALSAGAAAVVWTTLRHVPVLAPLAAVATYLLVNDLLVGPAVIPKTGLRSFLRDLRTTTVIDAGVGLVGLLVGIPYHTDGPVILLLILVPMVVARVVMVFLARFQHAFARLEVLYDFTSGLGAHPDGRDALPDMLRQVCAHLGVRSAAVTIGDERGWSCHRVEPDGTPSLVVGTTPLPAGATSTPSLASALDPASPIAVAMAKGAMADGMVAPLLIEGRGIGCLTTSGTTNRRTLTADDLRLLATLAHHAAAFVERTRLVERLRHDSTHDQLTGLPNRSWFLDLAADAARPTTVLLADLDRFQEVNDTLGHDHGDALLRAVAARLSETFPGSVVARLGGDEFGILLAATSQGDAAQAAVELLACLEQPFHVGVLDLELTASVGVAVAHDDDDDGDVAARLLQHADVAMYGAKEAHSGWELYRAERDTHSPWRLSLASDLRRGLTDELEVHFQPKAELAGGSVRGLEALVRWRHPRYGLLSPDQFVAVAEQAGLIRLLTMAVLSEACVQQTRLEALGFALDIAVNLSVRSVLDVSLPDQVHEVLDRHGVVPQRLTLEITEGSLMADPTRTIGVLGRLAATGISISIDDFGTGYSSLQYLKRLPASEVKIDRSFVSGMRRDRSDDAIVRSTIDLAHNLGLRAVAEGIEDPETWAALAAVGCDEAQGYFLSAPLPAEALLPWLLRTSSEQRHP